MIRWHLVSVAFLLVAAPGFAQDQPKATASFVNGSGDRIGTATIVLTTRGTAVLINARVSKLPPGTHAVHVHNVGKCDPPDFASAGPHFNPGSKQHGHQNPNGAHAGDLPNVEVLADGVANISFAVPDLTLGDGPNSLFHAGGTALVIHAQADDDKTDPSGNAGARIACAVIERARP